MAKNANVDTKALLQAIDNTIAQLKSEYDRGILDIGRYSPLLTTFNTFKAEVAQLAEYEREAETYTPATIPAMLVDNLKAQRARVEKSRAQLAAPNLIPEPQPTLAATKAQDDEILVLIAQFEGAGQIQVSQLLKETLREEIAKLEPPIATARIESAPDVITDKDAARQLGERYNATIVIWGWYDNLNFKPNFTIVKERKFDLRDLELERQQVNLAAPDDMTFAYINTQMPAQMSYFTLFTIGQIYYWDKQYDTALATFERAITQGEIGETTEGLANAYFYSGYIYQEVRKDITATLQAYDKALELNPALMEGYNNRGVAYADKGEYDRAIEDYDQALALNPALAEVYNNRGNAYAHKGEYDRAIEDFDKALALNPEYAEAYYSRGGAYHHKGEYDRAIADYDQALALNPALAKAYNNRGLAYKELGEKEKAIADFEKYLTLPDDPEWQEWAKQQLEELRGE